MAGRHSRSRICRRGPANEYPIWFISRRGTPETMLSDNAPQFRLAKSLFDKTWQRVFNDGSVLSYIADKGVKWKFTTELAPWQAGIYERLVGIVKKAFKSVVGRKLLRWDEFATINTKVESIVNSRPLTYGCLNPWRFRLWLCLASR